MNEGVVSRLRKNQEDVYTLSFRESESEEKDFRIFVQGFAGCIVWFLPSPLCFYVLLYTSTTMTAFLYALYTHES